jgi:hypothetical protein
MFIVSNSLSGTKVKWLLIILCLPFIFMTKAFAQRERIYMQNEVDIKPAYPGGVGAMKAFVKRNLKWPNEYGNNGYVI